MLLQLNKDLSAQVSDQDADLTTLDWWIDARGYAIARIDGSLNRLHRLVMQRKLDFPLTPFEIVDHINGDKLDCRRDNLRLATKSQNEMNKPLNALNTSGYKGVSYFKTTSKWRATIGLNGKTRHLGCFSTPQEAARAYDKAAIINFGEFAYTNFPAA